MTDSVGSRIKLFTIAHLPPDLAHAFVQHVRDFDVAHPGCCHFEIGADMPTELSVVEIAAMTTIDPALKFSQFFERRKIAPAVHILHHGHPLCRFTIALPNEWPEGHKWTGLDERADATCDACAAVADKRGKAK